MLKKYLFAGILLGTIVLAGGINEETENAKPSESFTDGQPVENEKLSDTDKVVVAPTPLDLTQEQKEKYYMEYISILENVNAEHNEDFVMEPITKFLDEYWVEVKDFEKMLKERIDVSFIVSKNNDFFAPSLVPKTVELHTGSNVAIISFEGSFETQLNYNKPGGRQLFTAINSISSQIENDSGNWIQTGHDYSMVDGGRTYRITVGGKHSQNGVSSSHIIDVEFHCNKNGGIS